MLKIDKRIVIGITEDTVTDRLYKFLNHSRNRARGAETDHLRNWIITGFQIQELGGGVLDAWLSVERNGELDGMSRSEKAEVLISMLERISDREPGKTSVLLEENSIEPPASVMLENIDDMVQDYSA